MSKMTVPAKAMIDLIRDRATDHIIRQLQAHAADKMYYTFLLPVPEPGFHPVACVGIKRESRYSSKLVLLVQDYNVELEELENPAAKPVTIDVGPEQVSIEWLLKCVDMLDHTIEEGLLFGTGL